MTHRAHSPGGQRSITHIRSVAAGLLGCISLVCASNSFAQSTASVPDHVIVGKLSAQEMPALEVLRSIEDQTGYKFQIALPFRDYIARQRLSVTFQNAPLPEVMQAISESLSVDFSASHQRLTLTPRPVRTVTESATVAVPQGELEAANVAATPSLQSESLAPVVASVDHKPEPAQQTAIEPAPPPVARAALPDDSAKTALAANPFTAEPVALAPGSVPQAQAPIEPVALAPIEEHASTEASNPAQATAPEPAVQPITPITIGQVEPLPTEQNWTISPGDSLRQVIFTWGAQEGWTLVWDADLEDAILRAGMTFTGSLPKVITNLLDALPDDISIRVALYNTNKVIYVYNRGA